MSKKDKTTKEYSSKYFEVLKKFNLTPDFKLNDYEKDLVKKIDKAGSMTSYEIADEYDLRPSDVNEILNSLREKGVIIENDNNISLTDMAIKYVRASKEQRKTEKKFRNFLNCLDEKDLDSLMALVNSFTISEEKKEEVNKNE